ncbi:hypothetical protein ACH5RR_027101 [Cinchona calisaya]|uniref:Protein Asterix n=1 Tax=Cinchona calisaya TaxID=153742 RepID=A0ABD2Z5M7_9GENT
MSSSQQQNDPRLPSAARPYKALVLAPQDLPVDYSGFLAVIFGVFGAMFRYKVCSWLAIIFSAQALSNMRNFENDFKQISMAMIREHVTEDLNSSIICLLRCKILDAVLRRSRNVKEYRMMLHPFSKGLTAVQA